MVHQLWHLLLGSYCVLCREPVKGADAGRQLCSYCLASLPWLTDPESAELSGIQRSFAPLAYQGAARRWVLEAKHEGGLIIVSGHSNTTPFVANALLGKDKFTQLDESEYNKIFVVTVSEKGKGTVSLLNY